MKNVIITLFISVFFISCSENIYTENGVSKSLALYRKERISDLKYSLRFIVPENREQTVTGNVSINFTVSNPCDIVLDFVNSEVNISEVISNNSVSEYIFKNEHIIIPEKEIVIGKNTIDIAFAVSNQSLNRRDDLLYTLLVPDRARTLFPCFDQPDMKALYTLQLEVPKYWEAVANGKVLDSKEKGGSKILNFKETEPISTYLFSFVTGKLEKTTQTHDGRSVSLYHRETDHRKIAQCNEILNQVFYSLRWMEEYTGIAYPFAKYDLIILPGFQFGGMEHTGATLYSDRTMFLNENPTINEQLSRSKLIAHETSHMWFGDYVTMEWFSDVWTKEVFANYFASQIVAPMYKDVNHDLNFMMTYIPLAYSEERTEGTNAIQQELDNLNNAGLVYGKIIYNKSPVIMEMMVNTIGKDAFREGIREYLTKYSYSNASWAKLIDILDNRTTIDLKSWSDCWINEKGRPTILYTINEGKIKVVQHDPYKRGITWNEPLSFSYIKGDSMETVFVNLSSSETEVTIPENITHVFPNSDGKGYGFFKLDKDATEYVFKNLSHIKEPVTRGSLLITLYENLLENNIDPEIYIENMCSYIITEENPLLFTMALNNIKSCYLNFRTDTQQQLEEFIWNISNDSKYSQHSINALRAYAEIVETNNGIEKLYSLWDNEQLLNDKRIGERDAMFFSYELAVRLPDKYNTIKNKQLQRLTSEDRRREYSFIIASVNPDINIRDSVFNALLIAENRKVEPWAESALSYLNHRYYEGFSDKYIYSGLCAIKEIQRTGDIFFPKAWAGALLNGHHCQEAKEILKTFFNENPDYPPMLAEKIKQQSYHLR